MTKDNGPDDPPRILRGEEVYRMLGVDESTVYRWRRAGKFPQPVRLGRNSIGWPESEIRDWIANRPRV